ncbi:hypothetical protein [Parasitella parasitica]|uniref:Uncharacterized protein n=1 Tax=Parasitella parasitica TaxID=35722 RepID=A0A0B7N4Y1_9FUNG|nr:hypothetical protein [Parasitella parasitica]
MEGLNNWYLPLEVRPETDITTKLILSNKTVTNTVVYYLLAEWADGKRSDVFYIPRNGVTYDLSPIFFEVQNRVDQQFMLMIINYCTNAYDRYEVLPLELVFVVGKFANTRFEEKSVRKANTPYILETQCEHWAKSANFVSAMSIGDYIQNPMDPFVELT